MISLRYRLLDVFTDRVFGGNPLAVFPDAAGLADETMQSIARELNLSETVFVLPTDTEGADWRLRIFTPAIELPMAGHPTVGAGYVLGGMEVPDDGSPRRLRLEEGVGVLDVEVRFANGAPDLVSMHQPLPDFEDSPIDRSTLARVVGLEEAQLDPALPVETGSSGVRFHLIPVLDRRALAAARLDARLWQEHLADSPAPHVYLFHRPRGDGEELFCRMFAPAMDIPEDPATGAAAGPLAAYVVRHSADGSETRRAARITIHQGIEMGRPSRIEARVEHIGGRIVALRIGGRCQTVGHGTLTVPEQPLGDAPVSPAGGAGR